MIQSGIRITFLIEGKYFFEIRLSRVRELNHFSLRALGRVTFLPCVRARM